MTSASVVEPYARSVIRSDEFWPVIQRGASFGELLNIGEEGSPDLLECLFRRAAMLLRAPLPEQRTDTEHIRFRHCRIDHTVPFGLRFRQGFSGNSRSRKFTLDTRLQYPCTPGVRRLRNPSARVHAAQVQIPLLPPVGQSLDCAVQPIRGSRKHLLPDWRQFRSLRYF